MYKRQGDPTELALLDMGNKLNISKEDLEETNPRINEQAFDSARKLMTTVHKDRSGKVMSYTKGAMDILLNRCSKIYINGETTDISRDHIDNINKAATEMAKGALRVLALGIKEDDDSAREEDLTFVGLVGMIDPPRPEAKDSVKTLKQAGIRTIIDVYKRQPDNRSYTILSRACTNPVFVSKAKYRSFTLNTCTIFPPKFL